MTGSLNGSGAFLGTESPPLPGAGWTEGKTAAELCKNECVIPPGLEPGTTSVLRMCHNQLDQGTLLKVPCTPMSKTQKVPQKAGGRGTLIHRTGGGNEPPPPDIPGWDTAREGAGGLVRAWDWLRGQNGPRWEGMPERIPACPPCRRPPAGPRRSSSSSARGAHPLAFPNIGASMLVVVVVVIVVV
jgi:hypothetical protein